MVKRKPSLVVVLVTAPNLRVARRMACGAVTAHLAACVNLLPGLESQYRWQGRIETGREVLMLFKTSQARVAALQKLVVAQHPYDTPEFVVLPVGATNRRYGNWWRLALGS
jgi:periplasmic divalent cation tolerance protein